MTDSSPAVKTKRPSGRWHLVQAVFTVSAAFGVAKAISLVQTVVIARTFGIGKEWDAFVSANRIPELLVVLIAGGALNYAFIPIFSGLLAEEKQAEAWRLASRVMNTIFLVALGVSIVVFLLTPWLVSNVIAPGFDAETAAKAANLMRILLIGTVIFAVSGIISGILQSHNHFLLPAIAPIMYDVGILFGVLVLLRQFGLEGVAFGTVLGACLHLLIQVPGLVRFKARWSPLFGWRDPQVWQVIRLMIPRVIGLGVFQANMLIMTNIGSRLGAGSVSALDWGWRLMQIPQTLIGTAMGIVIFPTLATLSAVRDEAGKRAAMSGALRFILITSIPAAVGLIFVGRPLISLLEGNAFDASATMLVYYTLRAFMLGLIVHSVLEVVARSFYADQDTVTPLLAALGGASINLILAFVLSDIATVERSTFMNIALNRVGMGALAYIGNVSGLALANSLGTTFEVGVLLLILRRRWHGVEEGTLASTLLKTLAASLVMALAVVGIEWGWAMLGLSERGLVLTVAQIGVQVIVGGIVFAGMAWVFRMAEINEVWQIFRQRRATPTEVTA
jgi:putative peptidoglycan lipid II flippase